MDFFLSTIFENHLYLLIASFTSWTGIYFLFSFLVHNSAQTKDLSKLFKVHISEAYVSALQGIVCGTIGLVAVAQCRHDVMNEKSILIYKYCFIGTGYFMYDLFAMHYANFLDLKEKGKNGSLWHNFKSFAYNHGLMIAHHIILTSILFPALITYSSMGHFFAGCFFCMELSSPFVNFRIIISKMGLKPTKLYLYNGITMMIVFAIFRVLIFVYMYSYFLVQQSSLFGISIYEALQKIPIVCHFCCVLVLSPQVYWLSMMINGVWLVLANRPKALDKYD